MGSCPTLRSRANQQASSFNMNIALITGSSGLIGGESVEFLSDKFDLIVGVDNNMRSYFFGADGDTTWNAQRLKAKHAHFVHRSVDIGDRGALATVFEEYGKDIKLIIHAAAQPSHDWAAREPLTDFRVNATGTLHMLELTRLHAPDAVFVFTSTNKVYGDRPNELPLVEVETRFELDEAHPYAEYGIDEQMSIDHSTHSVFGASKVAADIMVQEYGRYFGIKTGVFRGGCLTGPNHSGAQLHGFLSYLMKCTITGTSYTIFGYKGKQVRDNIHSEDLVNMFWHFYLNPKPGAVYNAGGSRHSNCSMLEAIQLCEKVAGRKLDYTYSESNRVGDHIWYVSDVRKFQTDYPEWSSRYGLEDILGEMHERMTNRLPVV